MDAAGDDPVDRALAVGADVDETRVALHLYQRLVWGEPA
jgi:hypothetical protein